MIVPTNAVADDVIKVLDIPSQRVVAIPEAAAPRLRPRSDEEIGAVRERFGLPDNYLLWVGGLRAPDPRKRVAALARTRRGQCRSCSSALPANGRTSSPT